MADKVASKTEKVEKAPKNKRNAPLLNENGKKKSDHVMKEE